MPPEVNAAVFLGVSEAQKERELAYYRRECNTLGARLLRLQEEQSQAYREARRSRTVAKLIREAYRLVHAGHSPAELGNLMLEIIVDNVMCDRATLLQVVDRGKGDFRITHALGTSEADVNTYVSIPAPPPFFYTTSRSRIEPPAYELINVLRLPYVLWAYDQASGYALILGNQSESNVSRPFEEADQELVEGALSVYIDVLIRKQAEAELERAKVLAEEASSTRSRFLATLTHELRTPLNAVIGFSEIMARDSAGKVTAAQSRDYNGYILNSARQLLALINGILDYSSLSRVGINLDCKWEDLLQIMEEVTIPAMVLGESRSVRVICKPPAIRTWVWIDRVRFRQILDNLLSNAIRFTPENGVVELRATMDSQNCLLIEVQDTGIGMLSADIPRALEPFQQISNTLSRTSSGTGLGLPIAKGLAEAHGAIFGIESEIGVGTTVRLVFSSDCSEIGIIIPTDTPPSRQ